jgi:thiopeptide-type bacteriocin biosynthesis protein
LGRFCHDDPAIDDFVGEMICKENYLSNGKILAEIVHLPESRTGNVIFRPAIRDYEIPYLAKSGVKRESQIDITDLMVSVRNNRIVLRSKRLNKEIVPRLTTAHNFSVNSLPLYQFLGDLQNQDSLWGVQLDLGVVISNANFIPRISFKKHLILHPAKWQLRKSDFKTLLDADESSLIETFKEFKNKWKLPDFIALAEGDNELVINTNDEESIRLFVSEIRSKQFITLVEFYVDKEEGLIKSPMGKHTNELILSYYRENVRPPDPLPLNAGQETTKRKSLPGDEWLYYKIYTGFKTADEILSVVVLPLAEKLYEENKIAKWFFIRYSDPKFHLRLRLQMSPGTNCGEIISRLNEVIGTYVDSGAIWNIQLDTYKRELERYGYDCIEYAETIFFRDTEAMVAIVSMLEGAEGEMIRWLAALRSVDGYLDIFGLELEQKHGYIDELRGYFALEFGADKDFGSQLDKKFRKNKMVIENWLSYEWDTTENNLTDYKPILDILSLRNERLRADLKDFLRYPDRKQLINWLSSFLHMNINRIFRSKNRLHEYVVYDQLERYYRYQAGKKKALARSSSLSVNK